MAGRKPSLPVEAVRAIRSEHEAAAREGRRPRLKPFTIHGVDNRTVSAVARREIYRWVQ